MGILYNVYRYLYDCVKKGLTNCSFIIEGNEYKSNRLFFERYGEEAKKIFLESTDKIKIDNVTKKAYDVVVSYVGNCGTTLTFDNCIGVAVFSITFGITPLIDECIEYIFL